MSSWVSYVGSDLWKQDRTHAEQNFTVKHVTHMKTTSGLKVVVIHADAKTGSKYVVSLSPFAEDGSEYLASVLHPWKSCSTVEAKAVDDGWVWENLGDQRALVMGQPMHGGDVRALTLTVNKALEIAAE